MSAPAMPADNSLQVEQARIAAEDKRRAEEKMAADARKAELLGLRTNAGTAARGSAESFFSGRGLDPGQYATGIQSTIDQILAGISPEDPNPGSYFNDIGNRVWNSETESFRNRSTRDVDKLFAPNFETSRIPFTLDDPYLSSIEAEQRQSADDIIRNMLDRGVITPAGYSAAAGDLDKQAPGVRSRLNEIGTTTLAGGQQGLKDIANRGRQTASTLELGTQFDPYAFGSEADAAFNDFIQSLGDTIRGKAPGNLFNTAGLAAIAGAGQGAQNTPFNPAALAGVVEDDDKETQNKETIF